MKKTLALLCAIAAPILLPAPLAAQSPETVLKVVRDAPCPGIGGTPDIAALADSATRNRLLQANGTLIGQLGGKIASARSAVSNLDARQRRSGIDSSKQIARTQASIAQARDNLTVAMGFWILARFYDYGALPASISASGNHPLAALASQQGTLDRVANQAGDPRVNELVSKFRTCAVEAAGEYLDLAQASGLPEQAGSVGAVDALTRHLLPDLGNAGQAQLRRHPIFSQIAARRVAVARPQTVAPSRPAQPDRCALATANARRNLPMVRRFLSALQRRKLAGTDFLAADAVFSGFGRSVRGRDRIIAQFSQFGGSGRIGNPSVGGCGVVTAQFSGGRSGTIRIGLTGSRIQTVQIQ